MTALAVSGPGPSCCARLLTRAAAALLLPLVAFSAASQESPVVASTAAPSARDRGRIELSSSSLPLFDNNDGATRTRLDMIWLPPRQLNLGLALGLSRINTPGLRPPGIGTAATIDLGFQWRYTLDSHYRIDVTAWRRAGPVDALALAQDRSPDYGARLEMQLGAIPGSRFVAERGFLGLQLEGGARISVRRAGGHPMLYYRARF